ncbi:hypothetical protein HSBAA_63740 [Vreelandella sulfidaeris]|uniref:Uncharacterized protein n=1 Tax=Vreelandella sulfidaeris TaxID=115553 RepID=A0A455UL42_9GAMM|nr:hypothetical protein HSBAA_63740 [Halomonas sulfidaeris]
MHVISSAAAGGAEIYVKDLSKSMSAKGHSVFVVLLDRASESGRDAEFEASFLAELTQYGVEYGFLGAYVEKSLQRYCRPISVMPYLQARYPTFSSLLWRSFLALPVRCASCIHAPQHKAKS